MSFPGTPKGCSSFLLHYSSKYWVPVTKITFPHADEDSFSFNSHIIFQINKALDYAIADIVDFYFFPAYFFIYLFFLLIPQASLEVV